MEHLTDHATRMARMWIACGHLAADTHSVMVMRILGLGGVWRIGGRESLEMIEEKIPAFTEAVIGGALGAAAGKRPDEIVTALIEPLSRRARSNRQRLLQQGPRFPRGLSKHTNRSEDDEPDTETA